ncbi:hypothetical protein LR48_Vigan07g202600 [Vigna angularis]|uniref:Uncharacterized protein n=1 Tax=Phaseolus angularis TaxID=3914 RepID=A0A0L9V0C6_PHAAN|nr:hypothetical protein LR48_Vigan07g202600 [Vigna angularis]
MASSSAQRKRVKTIGQKNMKHPSELDGWISDGEVQSKFLDCWKMRSLITHKFLKLSFFRNEGFEFHWLKQQGLKKFVEMEDPWYPELVKVFYCNLKISDGTLCSRVKGVDIKLTEEKENIQVDWPVAISNNMLKVTRLESAKLPYCVFISKILVHFGINCIDESNVSYSRASLINKAALHMMGLQHTFEGCSQVMCQATRDDVLEIKEHLKLNNPDEDDNEDESGEEGSTPDESTRMNVDESEEEDIAEESNSDMLLKTYLKKNKMKV